MRDALLLSFMVLLTKFQCRGIYEDTHIKRYPSGTSSDGSFKKVSYY